MNQTIYERTKRLFRFVVYTFLPLVGGGWVGVSCSDTWDEHYESLGNSNSELVHGGSLYDAIKADNSLKNFTMVIDSCDFAKSLGSSQTFTLFAPTDSSFSESEARALIASYKQQKARKVNEEDNTVYKEFIQNHVALYNHSVSSVSNDSIVLMNGKYAVLTNDHIDNVRMLTKNQLYGNGVLFKVARPVDFMANIFEYVRKDAKLSHLRDFLYSGDPLFSTSPWMIYYKEFQPAQSVAGSIVNGKTQYLDSVFSQRNTMFTTVGQIASEDSTYMTVVPTDDVWDQLLPEYESYYNYHENVVDRDSLSFVMPRKSIVMGTTFTRTYLNSEQALQDSAISVNALSNYSYRKMLYGEPFEYGQYYKPLSKPFGALNQSDLVACSNGQVRLASQWNIDPLNTFKEWIVIEAETRSNIKGYSRSKSGNDSVNTVTPITRYVQSDATDYYNRVWNNSFVEFSQDFPSLQHEVTFYLKDVLSNVGYDIYYVAAPALAADSNATAIERLPNTLRFTLHESGADAEADSVLVNPVSLAAGKSDINFTTVADSVDYIKVADNYKFTYSTVGVDDEDMQATLTVKTYVGSSANNKRATKTMRIDCILLVPHGTLELVEALPATVDASPDATKVSSNHVGQRGVLMYPHGRYTDGRPYKSWYKLR